MPEGVLVRVRVVPRAARTELAGTRDGALVLRVTAPPVEGRATEACRRFLASLLGVAPQRVRLISGDKAREKLFLIQGLSEECCRRRLSNLPG